MNGLPYFEDDAALEGQAQVVKKTSSQSSVDEIMLWYCKLGHSSFLYLQKSPLYKCKICELSKHQGFHFSLQPYEKFSLFVLVHGIFKAI